jgi:hypothetical protein
VRLKPVRLQVPKALGIGLSRTYAAWLVLWFQNPIRPRNHYKRELLIDLMFGLELL